MSVSIAVQSFIDGLELDPELTVSTWADSYRYLSTTSAREPGLYRSDRVPFNREIMDCLSVDNPAKEVVVMKGAQLGLSECGNNFIGYIIDCVPGPILTVQPTIELAKNYSKMRIDTLIEHCPSIRNKVVEAKSREAGNTVLTKSFRGGVLVIGGGNSAAGLRSMPVRYLFLDEIDSYNADVGGEGSAIALAEARTATFGSSKKIYKISTPTVDGRSAIDHEYKKSSMGRYWVPCPHCHEMQTLEFGQIKYDPYRIKDSVHYQCLHCRKAIQEHHKTFMLEHGVWIHERDTEKDVRGFHISSLYSPVGWYSWTDAAIDYELALKDAARMKTFVNTKLGLVWRESAETPDFQRLYERREDYEPKVLPPGAVLLTAGMDVQKDRLEILTCGWGKDKQRWLVDYAVFQGDVELDDVWDEAEEYLNRDWKVAGSEFPVQISGIAIDTGFATLRASAFAKRFSRKRMFPIKGSNLGATFINAPRQQEAKTNGKKIKTGLRIWNINVDIAKGELFRQLLLPMPEDGKPYPPGFFHFNKYLSLEWFKGLCSEELRFKEDKGFRKWYYAKIFNRNEPLDTSIYARAALSIMGGDRWSDERWNAIERGLNRTDEQMYDYHLKRSKTPTDFKVESKPEMVPLPKTESEPRETRVQVRPTQQVAQQRQRRKSSFW